MFACLWRAIASCHEHSSRTRGGEVFVAAFGACATAGDTDLSDDSVQRDVVVCDRGAKGGTVCDKSGAVC